MSDSFSPLYEDLIGIEETQSIINYIKNRECRNGGFCFYRQEEPNSSDTYYAITIQKMLGSFSVSKRTILYLKQVQKNDGSYFSIIQAYFTLKTLVKLNTTPFINPNNFIQQCLQIYNEQNLPAGISIFRKLFYLISLFNIMQIKISTDMKNRLIKFVFLYNNDDSGFGNSKKSSLIETMQAVQILNWLNYPIDSLNGIENFLLKCSHPIFAFTNLPKISPGFIEHINAGLIISNLLSIKPKYLDAGLIFVKACQTTHGGFSRTHHGGIATLEHTYYAIHSIHLLSQFM